MNTRILSLFAVSALVVACGGGGDSSPAQATSIPLATAMANQVNQGKSTSVSIAGTVTASGQTVNVSGSGAYTESTVAATFEGIPGLRKHVEVTGSVTANGVSAPLSFASDAYFDSNYKPLGSAAPGAYCVITSYSALPPAAQAGSAGTWFTQDCYTSSAKLSKIGSGTASYSVEADSATTLVVRFTTRVTDSAGNTLPVTASYRVTAGGALTRLTDTVTVSVSGVTVNLTVTPL